MIDMAQQKDIDAYVGGRLRRRRSELGMSQAALADFVGLTFQQLQKYEKGVNRVSASKLYLFSKLLNVDVSYFYDGFSSDMIDEKAEELFDDPIEKRNEEAEFLAGLYKDLDDPKMRKLVMRFLKSVR